MPTVGKSCFREFRLTNFAQTFISRVTKLFAYHDAIGALSRELCSFQDKSIKPHPIVAHVLIRFRGYTRRKEESDPHACYAKAHAHMNNSAFERF